MQIDGRCHCGHITYRADIEEDKASVCNCSDCQAMSGSAFRWNVPTRPGRFSLLTGKPKVYVKTAESGNQRPQAFCPECGTAIYATGTGPEPKVYNLRVGAIVQRDQLAPKRRVWMRSAQAWLAGLAALPGIEKA